MHSDFIRYVLVGADIRKYDFKRRRLCFNSRVPSIPFYSYRCLSRVYLARRCLIA